MVAAVYAHSRHVEVALAVAEDNPDSRLRDASHLTWRTLPLLAAAETRSEVDELRPLFEEAVERVRSAVHGVERDNDYFIECRRRREDRRYRRRRTPRG